MSEEKKDRIMQDGVSRRSVLGIGSAALAAAALGGLSAHAQTRKVHIRQKATIPRVTLGRKQATSGRESQLQHASGDDQGDVGPIWYSYDLTHKRIQEALDPPGDAARTAILHRLSRRQHALDGWQLSRTALAYCR